MNRIVKFFHPFVGRVIARVLCAYHQANANALFGDTTPVDATWQPCDWCEASSVKGGDRLRDMVAREVFRSVEMKIA